MIASRHKRLGNQWKQIRQSLELDIKEVAHLTGISIARLCEIEEAEIARSKRKTVATDVEATQLGKVYKLSTEECDELIQEAMLLLLSPNIESA